MTNPTSNYGFVLPTATDLVTDLPADFEVALQGVDTRLKALQPGTTLGDLAYSSATANTNTRLPVGTNGQVLAVVAGVPAWQNGTTGDIEGVTAGVGITGGGTSGTVTVTNDMATTITASGDIVVGTGSGTYDNLPIGTTGQILTADTTVSPYKVKWATAAGWNPNYQLINSGGTSLSGSATVTVNVSGLNSIYVRFLFASSSSASAEIALRLNTDTGSNYNLTNVGQYGTGTTASNYDGLGKYLLGTIGNSASNYLEGNVLLQGTNSTGIKPIHGNAWASGSTTNTSTAFTGNYVGTSAITSVSLNCGTGNFDSGTLYVYGA